MHASRRHMIIEDDHSAAEYADFRQKINQLSDAEIITLAKAVGIKFDSASLPDRTDFEAVLDEAYWDEFYSAYDSIVQSRQQK